MNHDPLAGAAPPLRGAIRPEFGARKNPGKVETAAPMLAGRRTPPGQRFACFELGVASSAAIRKFALMFTACVVANFRPAA
jgi:hypothetical protein